ncbi:MAG: ATP-binding cassette domain-containing protein [Thermoproteales archaeon]|nr:ATP-binding cassette domain-containing protein [Thermoproteales archaeon]
MNNIASLRNVEVKYLGEEKPSLYVEELTIEEKEFVLLLGSSGSGKSTLLKLLCGVIPHYQKAEVKGEIEVLGGDPRQEGLSGIVLRGAAIVLQNPDAQLFSATVESEVSFGPENLGLPREEIEKIIKWALNVVGMSGLEHKDTVSLSGGQKQRTAIASVLALKPRLLLLDEPVSQLDPQGSLSVMTCVNALPHKAGCAIIMAEHRLHDLYAAGTIREDARTIVLDKGRIAFDGELGEAVNKNILEFYGVREPSIFRVARKIYGKIPTLDRKELIKFLASNKASYSYSDSPPLPSKILVKIDDVWVRYDKKSGYVLKGVSFDIRKGEIVGLMGPNASGKTTLMKAISGLVKPSKGNITLDLNPRYDLAYVPQNPDLYLVSDSVIEELRLNPKESLDEKIVKAVINLLGLEKMLTKHPHALSRGQRFRVAVAAALAGKPKLLMLDEPTTGQDQKNIEALAQILKKYLSMQEACALISTHDVEFVLHNCSRVVVLKDGKVIASGAPWKVLRKEDIVKEACLRVPDEALVGLWN